MTRRALLDDTHPGMATETTYTYQRTPDPVRDAMLVSNYSIVPQTPVRPGEPFTAAVHRWQWGIGACGHVGTATGATAVEALENARDLARDDIDRQAADPSPYWWQGAERVP